MHSRIQHEFKKAITKISFRCKHIVTIKLRFFVENCRARCCVSAQDFNKLEEKKIPITKKMSIVENSLLSSCI